MNDPEARRRRVEDREEIPELLRARRRHLLDGRRRDERAELFTEDGVFDGLARREGRAALHRGFGGRAPRLGEGFRHFGANGTVDPDGARATGRIGMECLAVGNGVSRVSAGHDDADPARVDGRWRIRARRIEVCSSAPLPEGFAGQPQRITPEGGPVDG